MEVLISDEHSPTFGDLPLYKDLPGTWFEFRFDGYPTPRRHWLFMGEIVDAANSMDKKYDHKTVVADRRMLQATKGPAKGGIPVCFYYEKDAPCTFKWKDLQKGSTLCVMYAESDILRVGSDSWQGVRVDSLDYACVLPHPLKLVMQCCGAENVCDACGKEGRGPKGLLRCTQCKVAKFCDVVCQRRAWTEKHKARCDNMRDAREAVGDVFRNVPDWGKFDDRYYPFPVRGALPVKGDLFGKGDENFLG